MARHIINDGLVIYFMTVYFIFFNGSAAAWGVSPLMPSPGHIKLKSAAGRAQGPAIRRKPGGPRKGSAAWASAGVGGIRCSDEDARLVHELRRPAMGPWAHSRRLPGKNFFCNMDVRLPEFSIHHPRGSMCVSELKPSAPFGPLQTPGDRPPRGQFSPCAFGPQGILSPPAAPATWAPATPMLSGHQRLRSHRSAGNLSPPRRRPSGALKAPTTPLSPERSRYTYILTFKKRNIFVLSRRYVSRSRSKSRALTRAQTHRAFRSRYIMCARALRTAAPKEF